VNTTARKRAFRIGLVGCVVALTAIPAALAASNFIMRSANNRKFGRILTGPARYTLYVFCSGTETTHCTGGKSSSFPALIAHGRVVAASGSHIKSSKLGTRRLSNGQHQVTYYGQPLYLYKGDKRTGKTNGEEKATSQGSWFVISVSGRPLANGGY
jgi:predicted lipoprotein with Yx(FWY)xxD motif